jgi:hypothetical protein
VADLCEVGAEPLYFVSVQPSNNPLLTDGCSKATRC